MKIPFAAIASALLAVPPCGGQSLADLLSSIQERKLLLEQAQSLIRDRANQGSGYYHPGGDWETFELISWTNSPPFPGDGDLETLGIEARVRLLNEARRHFQVIRAGFVNVTPDRLSAEPGARPPAVIRRFDELSLPAPPVADHRSFIPVLRELACKVAALKVTPWPVTCTMTTGEIDNGTGKRPQSSGPDKIRWGEINETTTATGGFWASELPVHASFRVGGRNYETNTGTAEDPVWEPREYRYIQHSWPSGFALSFSPSTLSLPTGISPVQGTCVVLAEQRNSPYLVAAGTGTSAVPIPLQGGFKILTSASSAGTHSITSPEWVASGSWVSSGAANTNKRRNERVFKPNSGDPTVYDVQFNRGYPAEYTCVEQDIVFLLVPSFTRGLDAAGQGGQPRDFAWNRPFVPGNPGNVAVSGGAAKFSIHAGRGESMLAAGTVQIQHGWTAFPGITPGFYELPLAFPEVLWGHPNASIEYLDYFTDATNHHRMPLSFGTQFRFAGSERDYEVLYETRFDHGRAALNDWPVSSLLDATRGWQHGMAYYREWQKPRLRQVLGREALLDIAIGSDDYTNTLSVYRIPVGHTISYNADGFVETAGLALLKTVTIGCPALDQDGFPTDDLALTVTGDGGHWTVTGGSGIDLLGYPVDWEVTLADASNSAVLLEEVWSSIVDYSTLDPLTFNLIACEAPIMQSCEVIRTQDGVAATEVTSTFETDSLRSLVADPLPRVTELTEVSGAGIATTGFTYEAGADAPDFPTTITSDVPGEPGMTASLHPSGLPDHLTSGSGAGQWKVNWSVNQDGLLIEEVSLGAEVFARDWTKWENDGWTVTVSRAPDGTVEGPDADTVRWRKMEYGEFGGNGFPGLPHRLTAKDGSGATWAWTIDADGSAAVDLREGLIEDGAVTRGTKLLTATNARGYGTGWEEFLIQAGETLKIAGLAIPAGKVTSWGFPTEMLDFTTGLSNSVTFDGTRSRPASQTDPFGVVTTFGSYDALDRPASFTWKGHEGTNHYNEGGFGVSSSLDVDGRNVARSLAWDGIGRPTGGSTTSGITRAFSIAHAATGKNMTTSETVTGISSATTLRPGNTGLAAKTGTTLGFGGLEGTAFDVDSGCLIASVSLKNLPATFRTTWTDAWGRPRKVAVAGSEGGNHDVTHYLYNAPASTVKRLETRHASGKRFIEETEPWAAGGVITRSGIDTNKNGALDEGDRFLTSASVIDDPVLRTTVSQTGNATPLMVREFNPASGVTTITLNGGEEVITETPDITAKTCQITRERGGVTVSTCNVTLNHLGQADLSTASGAGLPTITLNPTFRDDGSVASVSLSIGGATASAAFSQDGRLSGFTHPVLGPLTVSHTFAGGSESLAIGDTTATARLDGTASSLGGAGVMARGRETTVIDHQGQKWFEETITPATGAATSLVSNAAGAKVYHDYAAGEQLPEGLQDGDWSMTWLPGGLPHTVSLGRGGATVLAYTDDGARDPASMTWPDASSDGFPDELFYGSATEFKERDAAGHVTKLTDPSGERALAYEKNRLTTTDWLSGELNPYKVVREYDARGRLESVTLLRNNSPIHVVEPAYTGLGDEVSGMAAGGFTAGVARDAETRHVTGFTRGAVTQRWLRGTAGRITAADTNDTVNGAPAFSYTGFDTKGRRQTVATNRGTWSYGYRNGANGDGQLVSAEASGNQLPDFAYTFDGIGRRTDFPNNGGDALNRFVAMAHPAVPRKLFLSANPDAKLYAAQGAGSLAELTPFDGAWIYQVNHPGGTGGWVPWRVRGVLEGEGDPGAFPDAVAEYSGHLWFPPPTEGFTYDADGNRESSSLWHYGWDGRNLLVRARTKTRDTAPEGWDLKFAYDAEGRRFRKEVTRYAGGSPVEHKVIHFVWDGWDLLYERHEDGHGNPLLDRKYVWGPEPVSTPGPGLRRAASGAGGLLLMRETRGTTTTDYYPLYDGTGHVTGLADTSGNLVAEYWWGPFGELIEAKGEMAQANPWRWATKYFDSETGLFYFGHRYYDPVTGQWLSREPLGESESVNLYSYCHSDPINKVDDRGLAEVVTSTPEGNPVAVNNSEMFWVIYEVFEQAGLVAKRDTGLAAMVRGTSGVSLEDAMLVAGAQGGKLLKYNKAWPWLSTAGSSPNDLWILPAAAMLDGGRSGGFLDAGAAGHMSRFGDVIELRVMQAAMESTGSYPWGSLSGNELSLALDRDYLSLWDAPICCTGGWTGNAEVPGPYTPVSRASMDYSIERNPFSTPMDIGAQMALEFATAGAGEWMAGLPRSGIVSGAKGGVGNLIHLTDAAGDAGIMTKNSLRGSHGIFAVPSRVAEESTAMKVLRTGLMPGKTTNFVNIPKGANSLFARPVPIGPYSAWKYFGGVRYAPAGSINMSTGAFSAGSSLVGPRTLIYGPDVLFYGGAAAIGGAYYYGGEDEP